MMRNFAEPLKNFEGTPFVDEASGEITLGSVCLTVIGATLQGDDTLDGPAKYNMYKLASRISDAAAKVTPINISAEEISMLKGRIAKGYGVFVVGAAFDALEAEIPEAAV